MPAYAQQTQPTQFQDDRCIYWAVRTLMVLADLMVNGFIFWEHILWLVFVKWKLTQFIFKHFWSTILFIILITLSKKLCKGQNFNGISSLQDLHRNCPGEGICYYFAEDSDVGVTDRSAQCVTDSNCAAIVSIERYMPQECWRNVQPELNKMFCCEVESRGNELFQVTIGRHVKEDEASCFIYRRNCIPEEFVAIAFSNDENLDVEPTPYYTCISQAAYVQSIVQNDTESRQLTFTTPFPRMGMSIFWSHIADGDDSSLLCSFLISSGEFHFMSPSREDGYVRHVSATNATEKYDPSEIARNCAMNKADYPVDTKYYTPFTFGKFEWKLKVARGRVMRVEMKDGVSVVKHVRISNNVHCEIEVHGQEECDMAKIWIVQDPLKNDTIPVKKEPAPSQSNLILDPDETNKNAMENVHRACIEKKSLCYLLQNERGCLHKENCHLLVAVTALDGNFEKLHFDIIVQTKETGELRYVRPKGWGAWALSKDKQMGDDFVFTCSAIGEKTKIYPTLNVDHANSYFKDQPYQNLMENTNVIIWKREPELEPRVMCSFDIPTKFNVTHLPTENSQTLYNLKEGEFFVLMAQGSSVADSWAISYHTVENREVSDQKFSRKIYKQVTSGAMWLSPFTSAWIVFVCVVICCMK